MLPGRVESCRCAPSSTLVLLTDQVPELRVPDVLVVPLVGLLLAAHNGKVSTGHIAAADAAVAPADLLLKCMPLG
jgi:hypothetical protein